MTHAIVRQPLNEDGKTYQPGEALLTTPERAARLAELRLVEIVADQAPTDPSAPQAQEAESAAQTPEPTLSVETARAMLRGRRGR